MKRENREVCSDPNHRGNDASSNQSVNDILDGVSKRKVGSDPNHRGNDASSNQSVKDFLDGVFRRK